MSEILVARQPIFDTALQVVGYELLFRDGGMPGAERPDAEAATSRVLHNAFFELGAERVVGDRLAFVNLSRDYLVGALPLALDPGQVVLEVLEDVVPTREVLDAIERLRARGFTVALDDYIGDELHRPFLDRVDLVKVDCLGMEVGRLADLVADLRRRRLTTLAEKVETQAELRRYRELGFELFQGFFLMRPELVRGRSVPARRLTLLRLLARLQDPDLGFDELVELVGQDVSLAFRLLRHVNSAAFGFRRRLDSLREALVALGLERTRSVVSLLAIAAIDDKPSELVQCALVRAHMGELLAARVDPARRSAHFTAGLLSVLDALTDTPMDELVTQLPLSDDVAVALLGTGGGTIGRVLEVVRAYERGDWAAAWLENVGAPDLLEAYYQSIRHARELESTLQAAA